LVAIIGFIQVFPALDVAFHGELQGLDFAIEELD
jgi:hypothetical protein